MSCSLGVAAIVATLLLPSCSSSAGAKPNVVRVETTAEMLDGGSTMRDGGRLCLDDVRRQVGLRGCWDVQLHDREADPAHDYLIWTFQGGAYPARPRKVERVKLRLQGHGAEVVGWAPTRDFDVDRKGPVELRYQKPDMTIPYRFDVPPGRVHPYVDTSLVHVTWRTSGKAVSHDAEMDAVVVWSVPEGGTGFKVDAALEAETL